MSEQIADEDRTSIGIIHGDRHEGYAVDAMKRMDRMDVDAVVEQPLGHSGERSGFVDEVDDHHVFGERVDFRVAHHAQRVVVPVHGQPHDRVGALSNCARSYAPAASTAPTAISTTTAPGARISDVTSGKRTPVASAHSLAAPSLRVNRGKNPPQPGP